jgi:DNA-binding transcriptional ArsR family regulator
MNNAARVRDHREPGHFWADNEIIDQHLPTIGAYGFAVYMLLTRYANNKTGQCDPSVKTIASALGISPPTTQKALKALEDAGLIKITYRPRTNKDRKVNETNIYTLLAVEKVQQGTQGDWVPKEIGYGVPNDVGKGTQGDWGGVPNDVGTNNTHMNKTNKSVGELPKNPKPLDDLSRALFDLCLIDPDLATPTLIGQLRKTYKALKTKGATADQVSGAFNNWWYSDSNWTTRKAREKGYKPEPPKPEQILADWPKAMAAAPKKPATQPIAQPERKQRSGAEIRAALERIEATGK